MKRGSIGGSSGKCLLKRQSVRFFPEEGGVFYSTFLKTESAP
jgi:hypothetical protein